MNYSQCSALFLGTVDFHLLFSSKMNIIILASLLLSAVSVHAYPHLSHPAVAPVFVYGSHGHLLSADDSHGSDFYGNHGHQSDSEIAAHDSHAISSNGAHKALEAYDDHSNKYKNVGAYSHDKGDGFEKTYHYEKVNGHRDIIANDDTHKTSHGDHGAKSYHESRAHGTSGHSAHGSHNKYAANSFGFHGHLKSTSGQFGHGHSSPASSGHILGGYSVGHGLGEDTAVHQEYPRYPVGHLNEYLPSHGSNHGYSKVYFKGPGYGYHY